MPCTLDSRASGGILPQENLATLGVLGMHSEEISSFLRRCSSLLVSSENENCLYQLGPILKIV